MNVKQIVKEYLKTNGYDGLFNENGECCCNFEEIEGCPFCDDIPCDCRPGYKVPCPDDCDIEHNFHISSIKQEA